MFSSHPRMELILHEAMIFLGTLHNFYFPDDLYQNHEILIFHFQYITFYRSLEMENLVFFFLVHKKYDYKLFSHDLNCQMYLTIIIPSFLAISKKKLEIQFIIHLLPYQKNVAWN